MSTKEQVLDLLKANRGVYLSGQEIADKIYVTRASVWKAIKSLQSDGYEIDGVTNKGYRLKMSPDSIDSSYIESGIKDNGHCVLVKYFDEVSSTNDIARKYIEDTEVPVLVIAGGQTNGRGRHSRKFYSPHNTGLYMSLALKTAKLSELTPQITAKAAVALAKAIDEVVYNGDDVSKIKWVNDIYISERKVAGILTEAFLSLEAPEDNCVVVGFGVNIYAPDGDFPKEIQNTAGVVVGTWREDLQNVRNEIAVCTISNLLDVINTDIQGDKTCLEIYRKKSNLIGNYIKINPFTGDSKYARVEGIDEEYHLLVKYDDGTKDTLSSGEVSTVKY